VIDEAPDELVESWRWPHQVVHRARRAPVVKTRPKNEQVPIAERALRQ